MFNWFKSKPAAPQEQTTSEPLRRGGLFSTHRNDGLTGSRAREFSAKLTSTWQRYLTNHAPKYDPVGTGDDGDGWNSIKDAYTFGQPNMSDALFQYFATQSFIGHQACAIIAQHWLVDKICTNPGRDAIRQGYEIKNAVGAHSLSSDELEAYAAYDKAFEITKHLEEFVRFGRIFGIRVVIPRIESPDPDFYEKPFNPDGIRPGSYKGLTQVDPYWMAPILSAEAASKPDAPDFYVPTWWLINGKRYHRSHLLIFRTAQPADILKPAYLYSGVPIPQKIMERVYGAERTGNEAPLLAMTKRLYTYKVGDIDAVMADKERFDNGMQFMQDTRDNYGVKIMGEGDEMQQFDTSLSELAQVIESQYALACAAGDIPVNKAMGTAVGGLNNEGSYDESNYHETLESMQTHDLTPFLERHHLLVRRSFIEPKFGKSSPATIVSWLPLDSPTAKEYSEINLNNAQADMALVQTGAISDADINERLRNDKNSNYSTLKPLIVSNEPDNMDDDLTPGQTNPNNAERSDIGTQSPENKVKANSEGVPVKQA